MTRVRDTKPALENYRISNITAGGSHFSARRISVQWISDKQFAIRRAFLAEHRSRALESRKKCRDNRLGSLRALCINSGGIFAPPVAETYTTHCNRGGCSYSTSKRVIKLSTYLESVHVPSSQAPGSWRKKKRKNEEREKEKKIREEGRDPEHKRIQTIRRHEALTDPDNRPGD